MYTTQKKSPNSTQLIIFAVIGIGVCVCPALAQVGGPNRRVETTDGYGSASVDFTRIGGLKANVDQNLPDNQRTKPTFYLGISAPLHIDAGAQFEAFPHGSTGDPTQRTGWSIYKSAPSTGWSQIVGDASGSQVPDAQMGTRTVTFTVSPANIATLTMSGFNPVSFSESNLGNHIADMRIKRVIGITQGTGQLRRNGAYMLQTKAKVNNVGKWVQVNNVWTLDTTTWPSGSPNPAYLPANPQRIAGNNSRFIIDLDNPWSRLPNGDDQPVHHSVPNRLMQETVNIDLRTPAQLRAQQQAAAKANPNLLQRLLNGLGYEHKQESKSLAYHCLVTPCGVEHFLCRRTKISNISKCC